MNKTNLCVATTESGIKMETIPQQVTLDPYNPSPIKLKTKLEAKPIIIKGDANLNSEKWTVPLSIFNELLNPLVKTNYCRMNFWHLFGIGIKNYPYTQKIGLNPCKQKKKFLITMLISIKLSIVRNIFFGIRTKISLNFIKLDVAHLTIVIKK